MQWLPCNVAQWIPIEWSGFHAASLNAVDTMQHGKIVPSDAVDSMQCHSMQWIPCSMVKCIPIDAVDSKQ